MKIKEGIGISSEPRVGEVCRIRTDLDDFIYGGYYGGRYLGSECAIKKINHDGSVDIQSEKGCNNYKMDYNELEPI